MIAINLMGGLGNQLFQIFTTIAYGLQHKMPFVFMYSKMLNDRKTYWDDFLQSIKKYTNITGPYTNKNISSLATYQEPQFSYQNIPLYNHLKISGYFQSYKYFQNYQDKIFSFIRLREQQISVKQEYINYTVTVSLHFRLGDYKFKQFYHPVLPLEYYVKSIEKLVSIIDQPLLFLYFCEEEDNDYVNNIIQQLDSKFPFNTFIKVLDSIVDWKQLLIMSCCHHQIIANSSFSWFSAYLNENPKKVVCYPQTWFGPGLAHHQLDDLFPDTWVKIDL